MAGEDDVKIRRRRRLPEGKVKDRIALIGVELEGGWNQHPDGHEVVRDGSVHIDPEFSPPDINGRQKNLGPKILGEIVSRPLKVEEFEQWVRSVYPKFVNGTCGLHVHMSFKSRLNYQRLMTPEFTKVMVQRLQEWAKKEGLPNDHWIWPRLNNPNHNHCAHVYLGDNQVKMRKKDFHSRGTAHSRYTAINYCYGQHQTVECRLLPMVKDVDMAIRGIYVVLNTTNEFLARQRERERKVAAAVTDAPAVTTQLHQFV
jgi:hypothetical protein